MSKARHVSAVLLSGFAFALSATSLYAGTAPAPAPLAGGGLIYLATGGLAGGLWLTAKTLGKKLRNRNHRD